MVDKLTRMAPILAFCVLLGVVDAAPRSEGARLAFSPPASRVLQNRAHPYVSDGSREQSLRLGFPTLRRKDQGRFFLQCLDDTARPGNQQQFFAFEGVIGAGKSTLLAELEANGVKVIPEPLERWQETGIFSAFYRDMTRWSYTFQMQAFISRVKSIEEAFKKHGDIQHFVGERSWFADSFVFEPLLHRDGHISDIEHAAYREWWMWMQDKIPKTSGIIYIRASPETCLARIQRRQREEESNIPLDYLQGLFRQHEKWLMEKTTPYGGADESVPVLVLDADVEFKSDPAQLERMLQAVQDFINDPAAHSAQVQQGGHMQGSVDTAGWQAFKLDSAASEKNSTRVSHG